MDAAPSTRGSSKEGGVLSDCPHEVIVEHSRDDDGSIWGRCEGCGEVGFAIRDVGYERWREAEEAAMAQAKADFEALPVEEQLRHEVDLQCRVKEFWKRRYERTAERLAQVTAERDVLEAAVRKAVVSAAGLENWLMYTHNPATGPLWSLTTATREVASCTSFAAMEAASRLLSGEAAGR